MRIGCREKAFPVLCREFFSSAVRIEPASVKMAPLDPVEAIDLVNKARADRTAQNVKRMRRENENRCAAFGAQLTQIIEIPEPRDFIRRHIEDYNVCSFQANFRRRNQQDSHFPGIRENFGPIEDGIMQGDGEHVKSQHARAFEQLMRGVIDLVLGIVQGVDVQIEFDPVLLVIHETR